MGAHLEPALRAYELIGLDDLLRALLCVFNHGIGQSVRFELIGVMAAQLPPVCLDDVLVAGGRCALEHAVGVAELLSRIAERRVREAAAADAQCRLDVRKLEA